MKALFSKSALACLFAVSMLFSSLAFAATTIVTPTTPGLWTTANDAGSGNTVISTAQPRGAGTASLSFEGMDSSDDRAEARRAFGRSLTSITGIGYDYWTDINDASRQPALKLEFFGARSGTLSWIPADNGGTLNQWNSVDAMNGVWVSSENGTTQTLAAHQADLGSVLVNYIRVGTSAGSNAALNQGYADLVTVTTNGVGGGTQLWDFESESTEPLPPPQTIIVTDTDQELWSNANDAGSGVSAITATEPYGAGTGSLEFTGMDSSEDRAEFRRVYGRSLLSIINIGYDFWSDTANGTRQPQLKIEFFGSRSGTLTYAPATNGNTTVNAWSSVDATEGLWISSENGVTQTLAEHQADLGNVLVNFIRVGTSAGSSDPLSTGFADLVRVTTADLGTRIWDFEFDAPPPLPPQEVVTVDPNNAAGWFTMDQAGGATGEITDTNPGGPGNNGSIEYVTTGDTADIIHAARIPLVSMADIREIGYDYYTSSAPLAPALKLQYFSLQRFGTLVHEPVNQGAVPNNTWTTVDATTGLWFSTEFGQGDKRTLAEWKADIGETPVTFLQVGVGSGWSSATSTFADAVYLATSETNTLWDFEPLVAPPPPPATSRFAVSIDFIDDSTTEVNTTITCNAGDPLVQPPFAISEGSGVEFSVEGLPIDVEGTTCEIVLTDLDAEYSATAVANGASPAASCVFVYGLPVEGEAVFDPAGMNTCDFTAAGNDLLYNVTAEWEIFGGSPSEVISEFNALVYCSAEILAIDDSVLPDPVNQVAITLSDEDLFQFTVFGADGDATCSAQALVPNSSVVEISRSEDCSNGELSAGEEIPTCTFTVTAFFEGVPVMSPTGLALMILMMMGIGFVGVRRFA